MNSMMRFLASPNVLIGVFRTYLHNRRILRDWVRQGKPVPPPHIFKQRVVRSYARQYDIRVFVETGTLHGAMVSAVESLFDRVYSIELSEELYAAAKARFASFSHVSIVHGDSSKVLPKVISQISEPCLFWLDGHYSEGVTARGDIDTPIRNELEAILQHPYAERHVILIDDARDFTGKNDYPTIDQLSDIVMRSGFDMSLGVRDDIIRVHRTADSSGRGNVYR